MTAQDDAVGRDAAAEAAGVSRSAAAFHLDRLVEAGLLAAEYRRLSGRTGPGAGRPAKLYRAAATEVAVTLPTRRYDLAAALLAGAVAEAAGTGAAVRDTLDATARRRGAVLAASMRPATSPPGRSPTTTAVAEAVSGALASEGYEPRLAGDDLVLGNCPFRALAADYPGIVCAANRAMLEGFVARLPATVVDAGEEQSGGCCVRLTFRG